VEFITTAALPYQAKIAVKIPNAPPALVTLEFPLFRERRRYQHLKATTKRFEGTYVKAPIIRSKKVISRMMKRQTSTKDIRAAATVM